jgi:hypothetical protein
VVVRGLAIEAVDAQEFDEFEQIPVVRVHAHRQDPLTHGWLTAPVAAVGHLIRTLTHARASYHAGMKLDGHLGSVEFNGQTVIIRKKMRGEVVVPLAAVQSVSIVPAGLGMSGIRFAVAGGSLAGQSVAMGRHKDLAQDPYAVTFRNGKKAAFQDLASAVNLARFTPTTPQDAPPTP